MEWKFWEFRASHLNKSFNKRFSIGFWRQFSKNAFLRHFVWLIPERFLREASQIEEQLPLILKQSFAKFLSRKDSYESAEGLVNLESLF